MKNKCAAITKSSGKKKVPKKKSKETEIGFERLIIDTGRSKKTVDELLKWYTSSN